MKLKNMTVNCCALVAIGAVAYAAIATASLPGQDDAAQEEKQETKPQVMNLYPLDTCPVSGQKLGSMGDPVVKEYDGREVRFCCAGCVEPFESDSAKYLKGVDEKIAASQARFYPLETCLVLGDPLVEDGEDIAINVVQNNRLFRVCCRMCVSGVQKDPAKWMAKLDEAVIAQQRELYPLKHCVVMTEHELPAGDEAVEIIVANRLVRFCCADCIPAFKKEPAKYIAVLDEAWVKAHEAAGGGAGH